MCGTHTHTHTLEISTMNNNGMIGALKVGQVQVLLGWCQLTYNQQLLKIPDQPWGGGYRKMRTTRIERQDNSCEISGTQTQNNLHGTKVGKYTQTFYRSAFDFSKYAGLVPAVEYRLIQRHTDTFYPWGCAHMGMYHSFKTYPTKNNLAPMDMPLKKPKQPYPPTMQYMI